MIRTKPIPRFISIQGVRAKVWFKGQPVVCDICGKEAHRAGSCTDKGKCLLLPWSYYSRPLASTAESSAPANGPPAPAAEVHPHASNGLPPLIHEDELDDGFEPLSGNSELAEARSAAEAVLNDDSAYPEVVIFGDLAIDEDCAASPKIVVIDEGVSPSIVLEEWFNQLGEIASQASVSILANCGLGVPSSSDELSDSQISTVSNEDNLGNGTNNDIDKNSGNVVSNDSYCSVHGNVKCYASEVTPDDASSSSVDPSSSVAYSEMPQASGPNKRPISEVSSDKSAESSSSFGSVAKIASKRMTKKVLTSGHI